MNEPEIHVREEYLPGIGRRYDIDIDPDHTLSVIAGRDGNRWLTVRRPGVDEAEGSVRLGREHAVIVGSLLLGARFSVDEGSETPQSSVDIANVVIGAASPATGKVPSEIPLPAGADAAVLAVVRDDTPQLLETDPQRRCEAGDRLVIAARGDRLEEVTAHLVG